MAAAGQTKEQAAIDIAKAYLEGAWQKKDFASIEHLLSETLTMSSPTGATATGMESKLKLEAVNQVWQNAMPDLVVTLSDVSPTVEAVDQGIRVTLSWTTKGIFSGRYVTEARTIEANNLGIEYTGETILTIDTESSKIVAYDAKVFDDPLGQMQRIVKADDECEVSPG